MIICAYVYAIEKKAGYLSIPALATIIIHVTKIRTVKVI